MRPLLASAAGLAMVALGLVACSSTGASGAAAQAGAAAGGVAGGASAGAADRVAAGGSAGGASGAGTTVDVLNPSLARPSFDCRTDSVDGSCVSISGTLLGENIDRHCVAPTAPMRLDALTGGKLGWDAECEAGATTSTGYYYWLLIATQAAGTFDHQLLMGARQADFTVLKDGVGGSVESDNFQSAEVAGEVTVDPVTGDDLISGTFRGTWLTPATAPPCHGGTGACGTADVTGTFRLDYQFHAN